jgi:diacylglycerol kinase
MNYLKERSSSFKFAFNGLKHLIRREPNARIHFVAAVCAIAMGLWLNINSSEWLWILLSIVLVLVIETINSSIESLADAISLETNEKIRVAKDLGAAATLLMAVFSVIVALVIFGPKLFY